MNLYEVMNDKEKELLRNAGIQIEKKSIYKMILIKWNNSL